MMPHRDPLDNLSGDVVPSSAMDALPLSTAKEPARRGLGIRLTVEDAREVRAIAEDTKSPVSEVVAILELGCITAIRSGALRKKHVEAKMRELQAMLAAGPGPRGPAPALPEQEPPPELFHDAAPPEAPPLPAVIPRRTYA